MPFFIADNIISSLGFTSEQNIVALKKGKSGIHTINDELFYPGSFAASVVNPQLLAEKFEIETQRENYTKLEKMMILSIQDALDKTDVDVKSARTGLIISTTKGNIDLLDPEKKKLFPNDRVFLWKLGEIVASHFGNPNRPLVLSNACISGVLATNTAAMLINSGRFDNVIVCGGDIVSKFVVSGFMSFLSLSANPCKPFDKNRDGLSLGEAAGTLILSKNKKPGENIAWVGGASANDANHISGPSRTGEGSYLAISKAFAEAKKDSTDIDHISAHGTATAYNDEMESISISRHKMESVPVNSLKGYWGHTLGAAGVIETAALIHEMRENTLIGTAGFEELGVSNPINVVKENKPKTLKTCLKIASGFGGSNAALVLRKVIK
jgi:3-oxoacyl-[acyl-carrier-protein] synthase-1